MPTTNVRAAFTTALQRPNFYDLAPYRLTEDEDISLGNPDLKPARAINFDLLFEHYFKSLGVIQAGVFRKNITDPIFSFTKGNDLGGKTSQPANGESAWVQGFELAYQQQLRFLPAPFDGLGIYLNYTGASSEAELPDGRKTTFAGQANTVYNGALSYEKGSFSGQLSLNFHSSFIDEFGGDIGGGTEPAYTDVFIRDHTQLDFSATYRVTPSLSVFVEAVNLTNEPWSVYQANEARPIQDEYYGATGWFGLKLNL